MSCEHDWRPIEGYYARYRCTLCGSIGLKERLVTGHRSETIRPYVCHYCGGWAVAKEPTKPGQRTAQWRCHLHRAKP